MWELYWAGRTREAASWLEQFPEAFIEEDPARILSYAVTLSFVGRLDEAAGWNDRVAPLVRETVTLSSELMISRMLVSSRLGRDRGGARRLRAAHPAPAGRCFDWDPTNRVITIMALAALVDEDLDEASTWVAAIEAATVQAGAAPNRGPPGASGVAGARAWSAGSTRSGSPTSAWPLPAKAPR